MNHNLSFGNVMVMNWLHFFFFLNRWTSRTSSSTSQLSQATLLDASWPQASRMTTSTLLGLKVDQQCPLTAALRAPTATRSTVFKERGGRKGREIFRLSVTERASQAIWPPPAARTGERNKPLVRTRTDPRRVVTLCLNPLQNIWPQWGRKGKNIPAYRCKIDISMHFQQNYFVAFTNSIDRRWMDGWIDRYHMQFTDVIRYDLSILEKHMMADPSLLHFWGISLEQSEVCRKVSRVWGGKKAYLSWAQRG